MFQHGYCPKYHFKNIPKVYDLEDKICNREEGQHKQLEKKEIIELLQEGLTEDIHLKKVCQLYKKYTDEPHEWYKIGLKIHQKKQGWEDIKRNYKVDQVDIEMKKHKMNIEQKHD